MSHHECHSFQLHFLSEEFLHLEMLLIFCIEKDSGLIFNEKSVVCIRQSRDFSLRQNLYFGDVACLVLISGNINIVNAKKKHEETSTSSLLCLETIFASSKQCMIFPFREAFADINHRHRTFFQMHTFRNMFLKFRVRDVGSGLVQAFFPLELILS